MSLRHYVTGALPFDGYYQVGDTPERVDVLFGQHRDAAVRVVYRNCWLHLPNIGRLLGKRLRDDTGDCVRIPQECIRVACNFSLALTDSVFRLPTWPVRGRELGKFCGRIAVVTVGGAFDHTPPIANQDDRRLMVLTAKVVRCGIAIVCRVADLVCLWQAKPEKFSEEKINVDLWWRLCAVLIPAVACARAAQGCVQGGRGHS